MPKIYAGSTQIKKIYAGSTQIKKVYAGSTKVYSADVVLTNLIGSSVLTSTKQIDAGYNEGTFTVATKTVTNGHKYYARCDAYGNGTFTMGPTSRAIVNGTIVAANNTSHAMITMGSTSCSLQHYILGTCAAGTYTVIVADYFMLVDVTELEEALNRTFTADQFWSYIGSQVFYGTKTIEV